MPKLSLFTKIITLLSIALIVYGYSCRAFDIYFFWESKTIGWIFFKIGLIGILSNIISWRKKQEKKSLIFKIGIGITIFILLVKSILLIVLISSTATQVTKDYIKSDQDIIDIVGEINGISVNANGGMQQETINGVSSGNANITLTVKGEKRYLDTTFWLILNDKGEWTIDGIRLGY